MSYMPGEASLAAVHRGKIKNIQGSTLRESAVNPKTGTVQFEKQTQKYDKEAQEVFGSPGNTVLHARGSGTLSAGFGEGEEVEEGGSAYFYSHYLVCNIQCWG